MSRKRRRFIGGLLIVVGLVLGGTWQFQRVNRGVTTKPVVEQIVRPHHWRGCRKVQFKMLAATQRTVTDGKEVTMHLLMRSIRPANYGFHTNNLNMIENMWLNIPYSISNQSRGLQHPNGRYYTEKELRQPTMKDVTLRFLVIPNSYRQRQQSARFSFLIPERSDQFVKYSVRLNLDHDGSVLA